MAVSINTVTPQLNPMTGLPSPDALARKQPTASIAPGLTALAGGLQSAEQAAFGRQDSEQSLLNQQQYQAGLTDASKRRSDATIQWTQNLEERKAAVQSPADLTDFVPKLLTDFDSYAKDTVSAVTDPRAQAHLQGEMDALRSHYAVQALAFQAQRGVQFRADGLAQSIDQDRQSVYRDPSLYQTTLDANLKAIDAAELPPETKIRLRDHAKSNLTMDAARGWVDLDPSAAYTRITGGAKPPMLPAPTPAPTFQDAGTVTREDVVAEAKRQGVPPELALSIWQQESGGGKNAGTSSKGALGGFQVMPGTFADLQKAGAVPEGLTNAGLGNMVAGISYLKRGLDASGGDLRQTAKYYYGGPGALQGDESITSGPGTPTRGQYADQVVARAKGMAPEDLVLASAATTMTDVGGGVITRPYPEAKATNEPIGVAMYDNAEPPQKEALRAYAEAQMRKGQMSSRLQLERDVTNGAAMAANGVPPPEIDPARFAAAYDPATAAEKVREYEDLQVYATGVNRMRTMTQGQMESYLAAQTPEPGSPDYAKQDRLQKALGSAMSAVIEQRQKDPVLAMATQGIAKIGPLDPSNQADFIAELQNRQQVASTASGIYTAKPAVFTVKEGQAFASMLREAPYQQQVALLGTLRKGLTDDATYRAALQQISPDAPEIAAAGVQAAKQPGYALAAGFPTPQAAAELILRGASILHPGKAQKAEDGSGRTPVMPDEAMLLQDFSSKAGDLFRGDSEGLKTGFQLYRYAYAAAAARDGVVVGADKSVDTKRSQEAFNAALGGTYDFAGHTVLKPYGMPDDTFAQRFGQSYASALTNAGINVDAHPIQAYAPVNVGDGRYLLQAGTGYLDGPSGPVVVQVPTSAVAGEPFANRRAGGLIR
jgi:hypothetical protein